MKQKKLISEKVPKEIITVTLRMNKSLWEKIAKEADEETRSFGGQIKKVLRERYGD